MTKVVCKLFGIPETTIDGRKIMFPFKKAEALFYYLIVKKQAFRDTLADLFWGSQDEEMAKKNLRNAIYIINKTFSEDVLISPKRSIVMLNDKIEFSTDLDVFLKSDESESIKVYSGEFLEGFLVKDAECFYEWLFAVRNQYKDICINKLQKQIQKCINGKKINDAETLCKQLIDIDEFNEGAYRVLMNIYRVMGQYARSIDIYHNLSKLLNSELAITPDNKTNELYTDIVKEKAAKQAFSRNLRQEYFYGRQDEIRSLNRNYYKFLNGQNPKSIIVSGEAGLGKSTLIQRHLKYINNENIIILKTNCYQVEESYLLKPWNNILYQLSDVIKREKLGIPVTLRKIVGQIFPTFSVDDPADSNPITQIDILKHQVIEQAIIDIFKKVAEKKKIILFFDDIQWIDSMSLSLIQELMIEMKNQSLIFIIALRIGCGRKIEKFVDGMKCYDLIETIRLEPFDKSETIEFASGMLPELHMDDDFADYLYNETEGNTFFITEFLNNIKQNKGTWQITPKIQDIMKSRLLNISESAQKVLNIASVFFDKVTVEELGAISQKDELELIDILDELQDNYLLKEINEGGKVSFVFTHQKLREFVYNQMTMSKRRILHLRIARYIKSCLNNDARDSVLYSKLIYHFENGGDKHSALEYRIKNLEQYLQINHEVFPVLEEVSLVDRQSSYIKEEEIDNEIIKIGKILNELKQEEGQNPSLINMEFSYLHLLGRSKIRNGDYESGLDIIEKLISISTETENYSMALKGYKQIIYYCINTYNPDRMYMNIEKALDIAYKFNIEAEIGILLRLKGMYMGMTGHFDDADTLFHQSIDKLLKLKQKDRYTLNIAADYNYLGECKKNCGHYEEAIAYYNKAIALCERKGIVRALNVFYTCAGQAAYDNGDYENAKIYFGKAKEIYESLDLLWRRSIAYGYLSLILIKEKDYKESIQYLKQSDDDAMMIKSPYEMGMVFRVKAEIARTAEKNENVKTVFDMYLNETAEKYCDYGIKLLDGINCSYEVNILKRIKSNRS